MSEPSYPAEGRLKAGCSQDWLPHKAGQALAWQSVHRSYIDLVGDNE
jgi:hypothetical protein